MGDAKAKIEIRPMGREDIPVGMRFKALAGWNQVEGDWARFLALSPGGCFVAEVDGEAAGTVVTVTFSGCCGWVAMVLVPPERRRGGIGTAMLKHGIAHLKATGVETIKLDATPMGRGLYVRLGFSDEYGIQRWEGRGRPCAWTGVRPMAAADLERVAALDAPVYGVDRGILLRALFREQPELCGVFENGRGGVEGYVMGRPGSQAYQIGPLAAETEAAGRALFGWALDRLAGQPVFLDAPLANRVAMDLAEAHGFVRHRELTRMSLGRKGYGGEPERMYATSGPEKG